MAKLLDARIGDRRSDKVEQAQFFQCRQLLDSLIADLRVVETEHAHSRQSPQLGQPFVGDFCGVQIQFGQIRERAKDFQSRIGRWRVGQPEPAEFFEPADLLQGPIADPRVVEEQSFELLKSGQVAKPLARDLRFADIELSEVCEFGKRGEAPVGHVGPPQTELSQPSHPPKLFDASVRHVATVEAEPTQLLERSDLLQTLVGDIGVIKLQNREFLEGFEQMHVLVGELLVCQPECPNKREIVSRLLEKQVAKDLSAPLLDLLERPSLLVAFRPCPNAGNHQADSQHANPRPSHCATSRPLFEAVFPQNDNRVNRNSGPSFNRTRRPTCSFSPRLSGEKDGETVFSPGESRCRAPSWPLAGGRGLGVTRVAAKLSRRASRRFLPSYSRWDPSAAQGFAQQFRLPFQSFENHGAETSSRSKANDVIDPRGEIN